MTRKTGNVYQQFSIQLKTHPKKAKTIGHNGKYREAQSSTSHL